MVRRSGGTLGRLGLALLLCWEIAAVLLLGAYGQRKHRLHLPTLHRCAEATSSLQLTGVALWSEATYCRQPALADLFAPCGTHPGALETLPAGSLVRPPHPLAASPPGGPEP